MKVAGKKIAMARFVKDPMLCPTPKQAFMFNQHPGWEAYLTEHEGVYVKTDKGVEHYIGAGNIESVRFAQDEEKRPRLKSGAV